MCRRGSRHDVKETRDVVAVWIAEPLPVLPRSSVVIVTLAAEVGALTRELLSGVI